MKKITRATFKSFIRKAGDNLLIKVVSEFNGMVDGVEQVEDSFDKATKTDSNVKNTLGFVGIWLVGSSRDYFTHFEDNNYIGIEYSNCCGSGIIAVEK
ncbi:MAG: hypothetical protein PHI32_08000 [Dysgonamonadaceae bacterium]|nr:hypothetical protein [Dysgonamonadaceae bacterium]MDD4729719.1 hypothetical protein [Dysgonamonadaceae bacterium]